MFNLDRDIKIVKQTSQTSHMPTNSQTQIEHKILSSFYHSHVHAFDKDYTPVFLVGPSHSKAHQVQ